MGDALIGTRHCRSVELKTGTNWSRDDIKRHQKKRGPKTARYRSGPIAGERAERVAHGVPGYITVERTASMWAVWRGKLAPRIRLSDEDEPATPGLQPCRPSIELPRPAAVYPINSHHNTPYV